MQAQPLMRLRGRACEAHEGKGMAGCKGPPKKEDCPQVTSMLIAPLSMQMQPEEAHRYG